MLFQFHVHRVALPPLLAIRVILPWNDSGVAGASDLTELSLPKTQGLPESLSD